MDENYGNGNIAGQNGQEDNTSAPYNQASGSQSFGSQAPGSQSFGSQPSGSQPSGSQSFGSQPSGSQSFGSQPSGTVRSGYNPNGTEDERPAGSSYNTSSYGSQYAGNAGTKYDGSASSFGSAPNYGNSANYDNSPNSGYRNTSQGYSSNYDSYRFETPHPAAGTGSGTQYSFQPDHKSRHSGKKNEIGKKIGLIAGLGALFGLIAALVFFGVTLVANSVSGKGTGSGKGSVTAAPTPTVTIGNTQKGSSSSSTGKSDTDSAADSGKDMTVPEVVSDVMPSMVAITNTSIQEYQNIFGQSQKAESVSAGSGIIVGETDTELLIATNNHVISDSSEITVTFVDEAAVAGTVKGADSENDLAIVAVKLSDISSDTLGKIKVVTIGDSDQCQVGESVVAIGNALGYGQSVSSGIVSALNREVTVDNVTHKLIQTDASINPGNSGGALLNMRGELIGINEVKYVDTEVEGVGYAIPTATAKPILQALGNKATRQKVSSDQASYIGIKCIDVPDSYVQSGYPDGVYVSEVTKGGPADKAGIKVGDIITGIDGYSVTGTSELLNELAYYAAGETIDFSVSSVNSAKTAYEGKKVSVTLGSKADAGLTDSTGDSSSDSGTDESSAAENSGGTQGQLPGGIGTPNAGGTNNG